MGLVLQRADDGAHGGAGASGSGEDDDADGEDENPWALAKHERSLPRKARKAPASDAVEEEESGTLEIHLAFAELHKETETKKVEKKSAINNGQLMLLRGFLAAIDSVPEHDGRTINKKLDELIQYVTMLCRKNEALWRWLAVNGFLRLVSRFNKYDCHNKWCIDARGILG
jgi:hypothetical protein